MYAEKVFDQTQLPLRIITINKLTWILSEGDKMSAWGTAHPIASISDEKHDMSNWGQQQLVLSMGYAVFDITLEALANIVGSRIKLGKWG